MLSPWRRSAPFSIVLVLVEVCWRWSLLLGVVVIVPPPHILRVWFILVISGAIGVPSILRLVMVPIIVLPIVISLVTRGSPGRRPSVWRWSFRRIPPCWRSPLLWVVTRRWLLGAYFVLLLILSRLIFRIIRQVFIFGFVVMIILLIRILYSFFLPIQVVRMKPWNSVCC